MQFEHVQEAYQAYHIPMPALHRNEKFDECGNRELAAKLMTDKEARGVFFSYTYHGVLRVYVTLDEDRDVYNDEISTLLRSSIEKSHCETGVLFVRKKTPSLIAFLEHTFHIAPSDELFFYESKKMAIHREQFNKQFESGVLEIRPYDDSYLDDCLRIGDESLLFCMPPSFRADEREHHQEQFRFYRGYLTFETFWNDDKLVGYYWNNKNEVDFIAVSPEYQRMGYGTIILNRAIEKIFEMTDNDIAWLIVSSFNEKACAFYVKNGMAVHEEYRIPRIGDSITSDLEMRAEYGVS